MGNEEQNTLADRAKSPLNALATAPLRSCQECIGYAPESEMVALNDGRIVCRSCARKVRKMGAERAQLSMFGQDSLMF